MKAGWFFARVLIFKIKRLGVCLGRAKEHPWATLCLHILHNNFVSCVLIRFKIICREQHGLFYPWSNFARGVNMIDSTCLIVKENISNRTGHSFSRKELRCLIRRMQAEHFFEGYISDEHALGIKGGYLRLSPDLIGCGHSQMMVPWQFTTLREQFIVHMQGINRFLAQAVCLLNQYV